MPESRRFMQPLRTRCCKKSELHQRQLNMSHGESQRARQLVKLRQERWDTAEQELLTRKLAAARQLLANEMRPAGRVFRQYLAGCREGCLGPFAAEVQHLSSHAAEQQHRPSRSQQPRRTLLAGIAQALTQGPPTINPFALVKPELSCVSARIRQAVTTEIPALHQAATYFFQSGAEGKRIRPTICLLVSSALSSATPPADHFTTVDLRPVSAVPLETRRRQQRIAEIAELIHVASLLHDDVIDGADTRRGRTALNHVLGNKVAILAGDFLLARASMTLASLKDSDVVTLMSQILEDLISGEILQATAASSALTSMELYLRKTYLKTASLMANACEAAAVVSNAGDDARRAARQFGENLGLAFQVVDDVLDFTGKSSVMGKPALNDIRAGVVTCPVLFAADEHPELLPLILRKFRDAGDVERAIELVQRSSGIERSRELAQTFVERALACLDEFGPTGSEHAVEARRALQALCAKVLDRDK